jgi:hypothetical protein
MNGFRLHWLPLACLAMLAAGSVSGCGSRRPTPVQVSGQVTLDGKPVDAAAVTLMPDGGGRPASGTTDASGAFKLSTFTAGDGALPGEYTAVVTKYDAKAGAAAPPTDGAGEGLMGAMPEVTKSLLPEAYSSPKTSGLKVSVKKGMPAIQLALSAANTPAAGK